MLSLLELILRAQIIREYFFINVEAFEPLRAKKSENTPTDHRNVHEGHNLVEDRYLLFDFWRFTD